MLQNLLLLITFFSLPLAVLSQKYKVEEADIAFAQAMKTEFEEASVAALESQTDINFVFDEGTQNVIVEVQERVILIGLKPNYKHRVVNFFSENSQIIRSEVFNAKKKKQPVIRKQDKYFGEDIFYSDAQVAHFTVDFPVIGTRREVIVTKKYYDIRYFISTYFPKLYPVKERRINWEIPAWLNMEIKQINCPTLEVKGSIDPKENTERLSYVMHDLAPQKNEINSKGPSHLYPHLFLLYHGFQYKGYRHQGFKATKDLYDWYQGLVKLTNNQTTEITALAQSLTKDLSGEAEKIKAVYYWVQENIRYIAFEDGIAGFKPDDCQSVLNKKYGDCKGMANLMKEMLKSIGFDARLVWIGTRHLAYDYSTPSLGVDNHMICAVKLGDDFVFLDATEAFIALYDYAERIQGKQVLIEDGDSFILSNIPMHDYTKNTYETRKKMRISEGDLVGTTHLVLNGESKSRFLWNVNNIKQNKVDEALKSYLNDQDLSYQIAEVHTSDFKERDGVIKVDYNFKWSKGISAFGDDIYVKLDFDQEYKDWTIKERTTDYLMNYKTHHLTELEFEIPAGYQVDYLPERFELKHERFFFIIDYEVKDNLVIYKKEIAIPAAVIEQKDFEIWNDCIEQLKGQYKEQVVLKKEN